MYGQNLGVRPDAPGEPIFTEFCTRVRVPDVFLSFEFQKDRNKNVEAVASVGVKISLLPLTRHIVYTAACCYRTSRDTLYVGVVAVEYSNTGRSFYCTALAVRRR